eukprot:scaffold3858_cov55-Attheya_sp.AAC.1
MATSPESYLSDSLQVDVLTVMKRATLSTSSDYKTWHAWSLLNFRLAKQVDGNRNQRDEKHGSIAPKDQRQRDQSRLQNYVIAAVKGFLKAISLGTKRWSASVQQDMLNLLTCLFTYGDLPGVSNTVNEGMMSVAVENWLGVLPQLLARIHIKSPSVRSVLHPLLTRLGAKHPQALMYPLSVLLKSPVPEQKAAAESLMNSLKGHSNALVDEALMVSSELIRVAILWLEMWHEGLETASRLYFGEGNVAGMLDVLLPLHGQLEAGPATRREQDFVNKFGRDLSDAHAYLNEYIRLATSNGGIIPRVGGFVSGTTAGQAVRQNAEADAALNQAWDVYYNVFHRINKQFPQLTSLELSEASPALWNARNLELGIPETYRVDGSYVKIEKFIPSVQVINSKQRPRKVTLRGSDGKDYVFLLKGHEDLRQDERVMQLFGLVNALLARDRRTNNHDLDIQRYAISPLSHNCGVVGWVPRCDTIHILIRDYRQTRKIPLNMENREMTKMAPDYDLLTTMQKVEVFSESLRRVTGEGKDLYEVLWLQSTHSEEWLERRNKFTRSLAVMSMVGYILGLGDRHPSNLMLDQMSGRILHIDFGDCFEVAMHREKFPEKIPFRLTRMLIKAMEVSGVEGSYRSTCERTMGVLRDSRDSLVAMLEAFVHDPLISWRLLDTSTDENAGEKSAKNVDGDNGRVADTASRLGTSITQGARQHPIQEDVEDDEEGEASVTNNMMIAPIGVANSSIRESISQARAAEVARETAMENNAVATANAAARDRSLQMMVAEGSLARSRRGRSVRQLEAMSVIASDVENDEKEETLNEKALKVIRRVQDKLTGTDFNGPDETGGEPLDVPDQVQRLIVQATSNENLSAHFGKIKYLDVKETIGFTVPYSSLETSSRSVNIERTGDSLLKLWLLIKGFDSGHQFAKVFCLDPLGHASVLQSQYDSFNGTLHFAHERCGSHRIVTVVGKAAREGGIPNVSINVQQLFQEGHGGFWFFCRYKGVGIGLILSSDGSPDIGQQLCTGP